MRAPRPAWNKRQRTGAALDLYCCTNAINYTVAAALARTRGPAMLLYEARRFRVRPLPGVRQWPLSVNALRLLRVLTLLRGFDTVCVPHHRLNRRVAPLLARARRIEYLDDGLDTLRHAPRNIDPARLNAGDRYHTFSDYRCLPDWLAKLDVRRDCALVDVLGSSTQPLHDFGGREHVFVESPGLEPARLLAALQIDPARALVLRHPVVAKRSALPDGCAAIIGNAIDTEGSLAAARGKDLYFGETMAFFIALAAGAARSNRIWLQMSDAQWAGLVGLPPLQDIALDGVGGRIATVRDAP